MLGNESYGPGWTCGAGCILGELYFRTPIFRAEREIDQLEVISKVCDTPNPAVWDQVHECPLFSKMKLKTIYPRRLVETFRKRFPTFPDAGIDMLDKMLTLNPGMRIASDALRHPYLDTPDRKGEAFDIGDGQDYHEMWAKGGGKAAEAQQALRRASSGGTAGAAGAAPPVPPAKPSRSPTQRTQHVCARVEI